MGKFAEKIKERNRNIEPKRVEIPELETVVFMHPLTLQQRSKILPLAMQNDLTYIVKSVIISARDEQGKPVFDLEDEKAMMRSRDVDWIVRLSKYTGADLDDGSDELGES